MLFSFFLTIALIGVAIGSYTDIKTLEVPDWLNYTMIALGLGGNLIFSIASLDYSYIINSILGLAVAATIGLLMYYTGQWGGGDSKVLFGIGALLGIGYKSVLQMPLDDFFMKFLINMLFAGAAYGLLWIFFMAIKNFKKMLKAIKKNYADKNLSRIRLISGILCILMLLGLYFLPYLEPQFKIILSLFVLVIYFMNYLIIFVKAVEEVAMIKMVEPEKLTEGDWIVDEIKIDGKYIAGPKDLGIEKKSIALLLKLKKQGKISKVKVKYGIPFVPSFLIALVYTALTNTIVLMQII
jgi:Flp pilus assembly protein protease CpaA